MSCHLSYRLTTVHRAISMALLYSVGYVALTSNAQAATIGKTVVTSAQHEPLAASICRHRYSSSRLFSELSKSSHLSANGIDQNRFNDGTLHANFSYQRSSHYHHITAGIETFC